MTPEPGESRVRVTPANVLWTLDGEHIIRALARASHGGPHNSSALQTAEHMARKLASFGVELHGRCTCTAESCGGDDGACLLCAFMDPEWPCPAG